MSDHVIETNGLTRYFKNKRVVNNLSFKVPRGSVFAFLGRNGSGKTTTIRMLMGLLKPTSGSASILGCDSTNLSPELRGRIGYMTENHSLYGWMTVEDCGRFQSEFYPTWNEKLFRAVIDHFALHRTAKTRTLSRGQRAGLSLSLVLAQDPEVLVLDDPGLGLDPVARHTLMESMIYLTQKSDRTILFSSHFLADVERVADSLAIIDEGHLKACCPIETFRESISRKLLRFNHHPPELPSIPGLIQAWRTDREIRLVLAHTNEETNAILTSLNPAEVSDVPLSLEEAVTAYMSERRERSFFLSDLETTV